MPIEYPKILLRLLSILLTNSPALGSSPLFVFRSQYRINLYRIENIGQAALALLFPP